MRIFTITETGEVNEIDEKSIVAIWDMELLDITGLDSIVRSNLIELVQRSRIGVAKYGTTLADNSSDDFLQHAKEEAMDFINYLEKLRQSKVE